MDEDPLRELLQSPLDIAPQATRPPADDERPGDGERSWAPFVLGVVIAGLVTIGGFVVADEPSTAPAAALPATSPPVVETAPVFGDLPVGYIAIDDRVGARAERVLVRSGTVFVTFSLAVRSELSGPDSAAFGGGRWVLTMDDGTRIAGSGEFHDAFTPGTFTVAFPIGAGEEVDAAARLDAVGLTGRAVRSGTSHTSEITIPDGLPWRGTPEQSRIPLDSDLVFVVDEVALEDEGGSLRWHLEGDESRSGVVGGLVRYFAGGNFPAAIATEEQASSFLGFFGTALPPPEPARSGTVALADPGLSRPDQVTRADVVWTIDWLSFFSADASLSLDEIPVQVVTG